MHTSCGLYKSFENIRLSSLQIIIYYDVYSIIRNSDREIRKEKKTTIFCGIERGILLLAMKCAKGLHQKVNVTETKNEWHIKNIKNDNRNIVTTR